ncbi:MAG: site-specific integrase [Ruminococcus sp.]|nr:site-specific integrase [Ruminococcus sp.]
MTKEESMPTFREYAKIVLEIKRYKIRESSFVLHWEQIVRNHLNPYFGEKRLDEIRRNDVEFYFIAKREYTRSYLKNHLCVLNEIFTNAVANDILNKNPCEKFILQVGAKSKKKTVYTSEETEYVLDFCKDHRFGLDVDLMLRYGVSKSELLGIKWSDIDFKNQIIHICRSVTPSQNANGNGVVIDSTKNEYRTRDLAIAEPTIELIKKKSQSIVIGRNVHKKLEGKVKNTEFLIYNRYGEVINPRTWQRRHYDVFMSQMQNYYADLGIDIPILNPHELRHTRASIWVNEGRNPYAIITEMGWSDFSMLNKIYAHRDIMQLRKQLDI